MSLTYYNAFKKKQTKKNRWCSPYYLHNKHTCSLRALPNIFYILNSSMTHAALIKFLVLLNSSDMDV